MIEKQNTTVTLEETAIQDLVSQLRGELLRPGDVGYEQACRVYNGMIEKRPALIAHCVDVADVIAAVNSNHSSTGDGLKMATLRTQRLNGARRRSSLGHHLLAFVFSCSTIDRQAFVGLSLLLRKRLRLLGHSTA